MPANAKMEIDEIEKNASYQNPGWLIDINED
jgi:hypothetical protein